jgi:hypothetical protein
MGTKIQIYSVLGGVRSPTPHSAVTFGIYDACLMSCAATGTVQVDEPRCAAKSLPDSMSAEGVSDVRSGYRTVSMGPIGCVHVNVGLTVHLLQKLQDGLKAELELATKHSTR